MKLHHLWFIGFTLLTGLTISGQTKAPQTASTVAHDHAPAVRLDKKVDTSKWKTYRNARYGFELKYPQTWGVGGSGAGVDYPPGQPTQQTHMWTIELVKPHRDDEPDVRVSLGVHEKENAKKLTIDQYVEEQLSEMKVTPEFMGHVNIGGHPAVFLETTNSLGRKVRATYTLLRETDLMSFTYERQEQFDPTLEAIVSSFRPVK
jgi:hypothetical protein